MKTTLGLLALLLVSSHMYAQDCQKIKRTLEPSTGNITWEAPVEEHLYLVKSYKPDLKGTFYLATFFVTNAVVGKLDKGALITFENGQVLTFSDSEVSAHKNGSRTTYETYTMLSLDELSKIAKSKIKSIKLDSYGAELSKLEREHLSSYAQCLVQSK